MFDRFEIENLKILDYYGIKKFIKDEEVIEE